MGFGRDKEFQALQQTFFTVVAEVLNLHTKHKTKLRGRPYQLLFSSSKIDCADSPLEKKNAVVTARKGSGRDSGNAARRNIVRRRRLSKMR